MNRDVLVGGASAKLSLSGSRVRYTLEDQPGLDAEFSCCELSPGVYSVLLNGKVHRVVTGERETTVNGIRLAVEVFDPRDRRANGRNRQSQGAQEVAAPMPGKVVRVLAAAGDEVGQGQGVVVVEAMKMQNELKSPKTGRLRAVRATAGSTVMAGQVLFVVE